MESLKIGESYFTGYNQKVLTFDKESILKSADKLAEIGLIKHADFSSMLNTSFIDKYHR